MLLAAFMLVMSGAGAKAQQTLASEDPFIRLTQELWSAIEAKCAPPGGKPLQIAVLGVPPDDMRFTFDQKDFLAQKVTAAASLVLRNTPKAKASVSLREVAELIAIMGAGESRAEVDRLIKEAENYNIGIHIRGGRSMQKGYRIALQALGRNGVTCIEQTSPVELPADAFPENIIATEELLSRAAQHVLERPASERETVVAMRSRMIDGRVVPDIWNESLARSFNRAVPLARRRMATRSLEARELRAEAAGGLDGRNEQWRAEIILNDNVRMGTRLELDLRPPAGANTEGTAYDGLIDPDSLPPVPVARLAAAPVPETSATRSVAPPKPAAPAPVPVPAPAPAAAKPVVPPLPLKLSAQRVRLTLDAATPRREFALSLPQTTLVEIDLQELAKEDGPNVQMLEGTSRIIAPLGPPAQTRPHLKRWRLPAGAYTLWLEHKVQKPIDFVMRTRASLDSLMPEPAGSLVRVAGDWAVGLREMPGGQRVCYAFTAATLTEPANWRVLTPFLLFQITNASDEVQHRFDNAEDWAKPEAVTVDVQRGGAWSRLPLRPEDRVLKSLDACKAQQGLCLPDATLFGLSSGLKLSMLGATKEGKQGMVEYSLHGYQAAMYAMASLCERKQLATNLVVRR